MKEEILKLAKDLIRMKSITSNKKACLEALNFAADYLKNEIEFERFEKKGVTSYLWSSSENKLNPKILLSGHLDVVDAKNELFEPVVEKGVLKGRGAGDMKGQVAAMLWVFKKVIEENSNADIALLLTTDEEVGGFHGTRYAIERGLKPEVVIIPDGGSDFDIVVSEKAPHHFTLESRGEGGHASNAFKINNPINSIINFYEESRKKFSKASKNNAWDTSFEMTTFESDSSSKNKIASVARASFSWRWPLEKIEFEKGRKQILEIAENNHCKIVEEEGWGEGTLIDKNNKFISKWVDIAEKHLDKKIGFVNSHGASDARHFFNSDHFGTKNIIITSPQIGNIHSDNEWIDVNSLEKFTNILDEFVTQSFNQKS